MKYLKQFTIIIVISFIGEILHQLIPLPVPASIYGIIILFVCLCTKVIPLESVKSTGMFLVEIMPIMFIPAAAGLIDTWGIVQSRVLEYIILTVITTLLVMVISGLVTQLFIRQSKKAKHQTDKEKDND